MCVKIVTVTKLLAERKSDNGIFNFLSINFKIFSCIKSGSTLKALSWTLVLEIPDQMCPDVCMEHFISIF